jgi:hypothetical protein
MLGFFLLFCVRLFLLHSANLPYYRFGISGGQNRSGCVFFYTCRLVAFIAFHRLVYILSSASFTTICRIYCIPSAGLHSVVCQFHYDLSEASCILPTFLFSLQIRHGMVFFLR